MEKSRRHQSTTAHSPRLVRSRSGAPAMSAPPQTHPQSPASLRSAYRSRSTTESRSTVVEEEKISMRLPPSIKTPKSAKKASNIPPPESIKDGTFDKFMQRSQRSSSTGSTGEVSKRMTRPVAGGPTSPSAWALSPGRISPTCSTPTPTKKPPSPGKSGGGGGMSGVFKYFKQKKAMHVEEMEFHRFRVVQNRLLQWRFANAKAEAAMAARKRRAEKKIFNVWLEMLAIRKSNMEIKIQIQRLNQEIKCYYIVGSQLFLLKEWTRLESKNSEALSRMIRKLSAISIKVPLTEDATANVVTTEDAMSMATCVMEGIENLIMKFYSKAEKTCYLLTELTIMAKEQKEYLEELEKWILIVASLKAEEKSLRAHLVQFAKESKQGKLGLKV